MTLLWFFGVLDRVIGKTEHRNTKWVNNQSIVTELYFNVKQHFVNSRSVVTFFVTTGVFRNVTPFI